MEVLSRQLYFWVACFSNKFIQMVNGKDSVQLSGELKIENGRVYVDFSDKQIIEASKKTSYYKNLVETVGNLQRDKQALEKQVMFTSGYAFSLIVVVVGVVLVDKWWNSVIDDLLERGVKTKYKHIVIWKRTLMYVGFMSFTMLLDFFFMTYTNIGSPYFMLIFITSFIGTKLYRFFLIQKLRGEDILDFKRRFSKKVENKVDDLLGGDFIDFSNEEVTEKDYNKDGTSNNSENL